MQFLEQAHSYKKKCACFWRNPPFNQLMKKPLFILAGSVILSFASCKKEASRACYTCTTETSYVANGIPITLPSIPGLPGATDTVYCDRTQSDIETIQRNGSSMQNITFGGYTIVSTQTTNCLKN